MRRAAALLCFFLSLPAFGVYVSGSGFGQALFYPYYTVQSVDGNAFNTYISIVNGHSKPKALRVRLREGRAGREVAAFNLFLDSHAIWTAAIAPSADGGAVLVTTDTACTAPAFALAAGARSMPLVATALTDGLGGLDRVREGYIEVLEMASFPTAFTLPSCENLIAGTTGTLNAPQGYLYGMQTLINVMNGMDFTENAVALAQLASAPYFRVASDPYPSLAASEINKFATFIRNDKLYRMTLPSGLQAVEAAMAVGSFSNEVVLDTGTASATDWVITVPTRPYHDTVMSSPWINANRWPTGNFPLYGYLSPRRGTPSQLTSTGCGFLCPGAMFTVAIQADWAASVLGLSALSGNGPATGAGTTRALGSRNGWLATLPMDPGGASLELAYHANGVFGTISGAVPLTATTTRLSDGVVATENIQLTGMPAIGFMARTFRNGTLDCSAGKCQGNYGGSSTHRVRRVVDPANP